MEFKNIQDYDNYSISSCGKVKNNKTGRILKPYLAGKGYEYCRIINDNRCLKTTIHNLVASTFLGNRPENFEIDHIDRNKLNNNVSNLRYVSKSDNLKNKNVEAKARKNKNDEYYNIKQIKKNNILTGYSLVIKQKYYGYFITLDEAIKKRDEIISKLNV